MIIQWSVALKTSFVNTVVNAWMEVTNKSGLADPWHQVGTFTVTGHAPVNVSLTPNTGTITKGVKTTLASEYSDMAGNANLANVYLSFATTAGVNTYGYCLYDSIGNKLYLLNPISGTLIGGFRLGTANVIDNGYIRLYCADTTITRVGNSLTVNWSVELNSAISDTNLNAYMQCKNQYVKVDPWEQMGAFGLN